MSRNRAGGSTGDVFERAMSAILAGDPDRWLAQCCDDVLLEFPFAPPGQPRCVRGKHDVGQYLDALVGQVHYDDVTNVRVHQSVDPETAVVEMTVTGHAKASGAAFEMPYIVVLTLRDGRIALYRDYWNPLVAMELLESA